METKNARTQSASISGLIADFNKQMEALSIQSPTEEFNRSYRESMHPPVRRTSSGSSHRKQQVTAVSQGKQSNSQLLLKPEPMSIEKVVSPVIEHTLQQQQLLLQQQQALIELQKDQQQIQKALQDQLKLQTLQTQMQIEQQNKAQAPPSRKKVDVTTTGTSMSIPSTPKVESRDWHADRRSNREVRSPERRDQRESGNRSTREERERHEENWSRRPDHKDRGLEQRVTRRVREDSRSPERIRDRTPERRSDRPVSKKDRRRLPQPTVEEMQGAVDAISSHSLPTLTRGTRDTSPNLRKSRSPSGAMTLRHQSAVVSSLPSVAAGSTAASNIAVLDARSLSPGLLIASYPVQVVSPVGRTYSPPISSQSFHVSSLPQVTLQPDSGSDTGSDLWKKSRRLPVAPADETSELNSRKLVSDRLAKFNSSLKPILRPSSSLDSSPARKAMTRPTSCVPRVSSPRSALDDIATILNSSSRMSAVPPLTTTLKAGKSSSGSLLDQMSRSPHRGPVLEVPGSRENSPSFFRTSPKYSYTTLKDQLKHELKMAVGERRSVLDHRDSHRKSENDLRALFDLYSDVPDVLLPSSGVSLGHRRNASDSALLNYSPTPEFLPHDYYASHDYDHPDSFLDHDLHTHPITGRSELDYRISDLPDHSLMMDYDGE